MLTLLSKNQDNIYSLGATICRALSRFTLFFLASYILPKYEFGIFNIFLSIYFFSRLFSENSLNLPFIKFSSDGKHDPAKVNYQIILLKGIYVATVSGLILLFAETIVQYTGLERKRLLYLMPIMLLTLTAYMYIGQILIGKLKMRPLFYYEALNCLIFFIVFAVSYFYLKQFNTETLVILFSGSMAVAAVFGVYLFRAHLDRPKPGIDSKLALSIVNYSKYTILSGISSLVILKADVLMLGYYHSPRLVAIYGMALFVNEAVNVIFDSILRVCLPKASALSGAGNVKSIHRLFIQSTKNIYLGIFPIIVIIGIFSPKAINYIYDGQYDDSLFIIYIFLFSALTKPPGYVAGIILGATGKIKFDNRNCWLAAIFNLSVNFLLIPKYDVLGAAIASSLSFILLIILNYVSYRNQVIHQPN